MEDTLRHELCEKNDKIRAQAAEIKMQDVNLTHLNQEYISIQGELQSRDAEVDTLKRSIQSLEIALSQLKKNFEKQGKQNADLSKKNEELNQAIYEERTFSQSVRQRSASPTNFEFHFNPSHRAQLKELEGIIDTLRNRLDIEGNDRAQMWQMQEELVINHNQALNDLASQLMTQEIAHTRESRVLLATVNARDAVIRNQQATITRLQNTVHGLITPPPFSIELNYALATVLEDLRNVQRDINQRAVGVEAYLRGLERDEDEGNITSDDDDELDYSDGAISPTTSSELVVNVNFDDNDDNINEVIVEESMGPSSTEEGCMSDEADPSGSKPLPEPQDEEEDLERSERAPPNSRILTHHPIPLQSPATQTDEDVHRPEVVPQRDLDAQIIFLFATIDSLRDRLEQVVSDASFQSHDLSRARDGLIARDETIDSLQNRVLVLEGTVNDLQRQIRSAENDALHSWELPHARANLIAQEEVNHDQVATITSLRRGIAQRNAEARIYEGVINRLQDRLSEQAASRGEISFVPNVEGMDTGEYG